MHARGIEPESRIQLVIDYVRLATRIERLTKRERDPLLGHAGVTRAVNIATTERRRLYQTIFAGARRPEPGPTAAEKREREAFVEWAAFLYGFDRDYQDAGERNAREAKLLQLYGEAPMRALIIPGAKGGVTREAAEQFYDWMDRQAAIPVDRRH